MKDGEVIVGIEKERLTRIKHDGYDDTLTIQYCLDAAGITIGDISLIVEETTVSEKYDLLDIEKRGERVFPPSVPRVQISHHLAHAYSTLGVCQEDEATIIVMDGFGSNLKSCMDSADGEIFFDSNSKSEGFENDFFETESCYKWKDGKMQTIYKHFSRYLGLSRDKHPIAPLEMEHSIAGFYGGVSRYIFGKLFCEGKTMGLAPFGKSEKFHYRVFDLTEKTPLINYPIIDKIESDRANDGHLQSFWDAFQYYADIARWTQDETERATISFVYSCYEATKTECVALAGGLILNAVNNSAIIQNGKFKRYCFQPAAGDNGIAVGCCYYGLYEIFKKKSVNKQIAYLGKVYSEHDTLSALSHYGNTVSYCKYISLDLIAKMISDGKVIAWFQGGSEFGPRALGHRSILADPRLACMQKHINNRIKNREEFRPFAPSVLAEKANIYFEMIEQESPHMILTFNARSEYVDVIPAVVHLDNSARVQTVTRADNSRYYDLILAFEKVSGIPILLNTSFNGIDMPIIETPDQAINFFVESPIDALVIDDILVTHIQESIQSEWPQLHQATSDRPI
jgi:carbamoyltransferase